MEYGRESFLLIQPRGASIAQMPSKIEIKAILRDRERGRNGSCPIE